jgi:integrase
VRPVASKKPSSSPRFRVGKVSVYLHHGAWWLYYREHGRPVRNKVAERRDDAERIAAQVNAQITSGSPTLLSFEPISVPDLRRQFLDYHEHVLNSSLGTVNRYRTATQHLENYVTRLPRQPRLHEVRPDAFAVYLRKLEVAPNGHAHSARRRLRDKGIQYILETCRSMYNFALKRRHLPPYAGNPFSELPLDRFKIEDAKPIFVFNETNELAFFKAASEWAFPIHFTLAKTGLRIGELAHLLIEDLDLAGGWLHVRNKTDLGWRIKTGQERTVPLLPEMVTVLRAVIGSRAVGPVFVRERLVEHRPKLVGDRAGLERVLQERVAARRSGGQVAGRAENHSVARTVWWDAGVVKSDAIRQSFVRVMEAIGYAESTCPKSWRHSFATFGVPSAVSRTLAGFRSRWTIFCAWA